MPFRPIQTDLPIAEVLEAIKGHLASSNTLIINAPPGAGKSTIIPLALANEPWLGTQKILMLEPRRLAARSIASRLSELNGTAVGNDIGYRIRFDHKVSSSTKIEILTEGVLTSMLTNDNSLEGVGMVIFDEFHERSIHADTALALCREAQQVLRPDLKILIMSATLNMPKLEAVLAAPTVTSLGRQYPVETIYTTDTDPYMIPEMAAQTILRATKEQDGDILAFFPGEGEIRKCEELLRKQLKGTSIHPLYGRLPQAAQMAAIRPDKSGKRKVVLATSIAETSLTIQGITTVVDTGYGRKSVFDPKSGLSRLETTPISIDSADQRAGRAGRLGPGVCYRMWTKASHHHKQAHATPEILEADLAPLMLDLAQWGIHEPEGLCWMDTPPQGTMAQGKALLEELNATANGSITAHGRRMQALPCHPRIAHMLLEAEGMELESLAADIAALLEEKDPLPEAGIDINLRIEALRRLRKEDRLSRQFARIEKTSSSYRKLLKIASPENDAPDIYETGLLVSFAYPERIAFARPGNNAQFKLANGSIAMAGHRDDLAHEPWLAVAQLDARGGMGKIFMAAPLNPRDLAPMVKERERYIWDDDDDRVKAELQLSIGSIVLKASPIAHPDPTQSREVILSTLSKQGESLLDFNEATKNWMARVLSLRQWNPDSHWPDVSIPHLLNKLDWLTLYLDGVHSAAQLKKLDLQQILTHSLDWEQQQALESLAPSKLVVPSGSAISLQYFMDGSTPKLSVRLQECFGLTATPRVNDGKNPVLMELLSPGYKPVQLTSDLESFWENAYFEVKKDLKRRYPKHHWPDEPLTSNAVRGVKRKG